MTTTIPGFIGYDTEGYPMWEPERLDAEVQRYVDAIRADIGRITAEAVADVLHFLTDHTAPDHISNGTEYRDDFVRLLVQLDERERARAEILNGREG